MAEKIRYAKTWIFHFSPNNSVSEKVFQYLLKLMPRRYMEILIFYSHIATTGINRWSLLALYRKNVFEYQRLTDLRNEVFYKYLFRFFLKIYWIRFEGDIYYEAKIGGYTNYQQSLLFSAIAIGSIVGTYPFLLLVNRSSIRCTVWL